MTLILNNRDVEQVLTMEDTLAALEQSYLALAAGEAVCRPRIDIRIPTSDPGRNYQWGTMEGGSTAGYFAIRMKSDVIFETEYNGAVTQEKFCLRPGLFCGLILLTSIENGEPLAFLNDGHLQHMRVGADGGIGVSAHIVAALTDSAVEVTDGALLEPGTHIVVVGGTGKPDEASLARVDVYLRFGDTPAPAGHPELATDAEHIGYEARPGQDKHGDGRRSRRKHGNSLPDKRISLADLVAGRVKGRTSSTQITYSERGNLQGAQFYAVAGKVYELARQAKLGREIPTDWFLQDIRN
jgi:ornithine cyclodeaminase/alanine dehydrogenase-like protein (mu-crystallin family)